MDMEHVEEVLSKERQIKNAGYISIEHYERFRNEVIDGLLYFADPFGRALGWALNEANLDDSLKILRYWNQLCQQTAIVHRMKAAKDAALLNSVNDH